MTEAPLLRVEGLTKQFGSRGDAVNAVDGVDLTIAPGESLGLVGESGCGKTTFGRMIIRQIEPTSGLVEFAGTDITHLKRRDLRPIRRRMQIVFQDPYSSLDPRMRILDLLAEPLRIHGLYDGKKSELRLLELMERCGLPSARAQQFPNALSGGQRQRVAIARALVLDPELLILDEPVSALDISVQAQILNLLIDLQADLGLAYLFIAHDLAAVRQVSDRIAVMYLGRLVEIGTEAEICERALHPYTQALLSSVPITNPRDRGSRSRIALRGDLPSFGSATGGCRFRSRCWKATEICETNDPALITHGDQPHPAACHHASTQIEKVNA